MASVVVFLSLPSCVPVSHTVCLSFSFCVFLFTCLLARRISLVQMHVFSRHCHMKMSRISSDKTHILLLLLLLLLFVCLLWGVFCLPFVVMYALVSQQQNLSVWLEIV